MLLHSKGRIEAITTRPPYSNPTIVRSQTEPGFITIDDTAPVRVSWSRWRLSLAGHIMGAGTPNLLLLITWQWCGRDRRSNGGAACVWMVTGKLWELLVLSGDPTILCTGVWLGGPEPVPCVCGPQECLRQMVTLPWLPLTRFIPDPAFMGAAGTPATSVCTGSTACAVPSVGTCILWGAKPYREGAP